MQPVAAAHQPTDAQPPAAAVGAHEARVAGRRSVVAEEPARPADHLAGADVVAALVPGADQAAVGVDRALGQVGELVPAAPGHREPLAVRTATHGPGALPPNGSRCQVVRPGGIVPAVGCVLLRVVHAPMLVPPDARRTCGATPAPLVRTTGRGLVGP